MHFKLFNYNTIYSINIILPLYDDYKNLFNFIIGMLCIYQDIIGISSVESDFSLLKSIQIEGKTHLSNILLERCIHLKQFNYVIQI